MNIIPIAIILLLVGWIIRLKIDIRSAQKFNDASQGIITRYISENIKLHDDIKYWQDKCIERTDDYLKVIRGDK